MKKIFLCTAILFFCCQISYAENIWVWGNNDINVFVEDSELEWDKNEKEFSVTVIDIIAEPNRKVQNKFTFYEREKNWFYCIGGKPEIIPVSKLNSSGYILDFAKDFLAKSKSKSKKSDENKK